MSILVLCCFGCFGNIKVPAFPVAMLPACGRKRAYCWKKQPGVAVLLMLLGFETHAGVAVSPGSPFEVVVMTAWQQAVQQLLRLQAFADFLSSRFCVNLCGANILMRQATLCSTVSPRAQPSVLASDAAETCLFFAMDCREHWQLRKAACWVVAHSLLQRCILSELRGCHKFYDFNFGKQQPATTDSNHRPPGQTTPALLTRFPIDSILQHRMFA